MKIFSFILKSIVVIFAIIGFVMLSGYIAVSMHWTDTQGIIDQQAESFWKESKAVAALGFLNNGTSDEFFNKQNYCLLKAVKEEYPGEFTRILNLSLDGQKKLAQKNLNELATVLNTTSDQIFLNTVQNCNNDSKISDISERDFKILGNMIDDKSPFLWANSDEWEFFKSGVLQDKDILDKVEKETGINKRILVSELMSEQMRLFYSDRAWFKKVIEPVKVLGSMTKFSWGVFGIKEETAIKIENNLKDPNSEFYLGPEFENMLDFTTQNPKQERFTRITDSSNHYYAYLYAALYNKQIITQWEKSGIDISDRPEILATLYNIGFEHSTPNSNPQIGGAELNVGDSVYSFGRLASEFYYSSELLDYFPQYINDNSNKKVNSADNGSNNSSTENQESVSENDSTASLLSIISNQQNQQGAPAWSQVFNLLFPTPNK